MKVLLVAINSKYIHSNLAVYYLREYANKHKFSQSEATKMEASINIVEYTINQQVEMIFQSIYKEKPDLLAFSCYIWNVEIIKRLCVELRKVLPNTKIWLGGPEVSYNSKEYLIKHQEVDGIMLGEGEGTFTELINYYLGESKDKQSLDEIKGLVFRNENKKQEINDVIYTGLRPLLNFNSIPFPYDNLSDFENKIIYYESSRGCPFSCSYCLSSVDKSLRLRDMELVRDELNFFLKNKVKQVKFIDRTFNCKKEHALAVWKYIHENDNGITNFHFEIAADLLDEEQIRLLRTMRSGLVQLEIGIQSTNLETLKAINRKTDLEKIVSNVNAIRKARNIHHHLDLIAGLPYEDYKSFSNSFNEVYALKPDQLQLGFLKVLKGTPMADSSQEYKIVYKDIPPYEVLYTKWINYDEVLELKLVEEMLDVYYNSAQFDASIKFMEHFFDTPFELYKELGEYYQVNKLLEVRHKRLTRYEILLRFMETRLSNTEGFKEILMYDLCLRENLKARPKFVADQDNHKEVYGKIFANEELRKKYLGIKESKTSLGKAKQFFHIESFNIDIKKSVEKGEYIYDPQLILFDYNNRNPLDYSADTKKITEKLI